LHFCVHHPSFIDAFRLFVVKWTGAMLNVVVVAVNWLLHYIFSLNVMNAAFGQKLI